MSAPWIRDIVCDPPGAPVLTRAEFVQKYFPKYVQPWRPNYGIRLNKHNRPTRMPTRADHNAQQTKRDNIINPAYAQYLALKSENDKISPRSDNQPEAISAVESHVAQYNADFEQKAT